VAFIAIVDMEAIVAIITTVAMTAALLKTLP
jgi:hypothetical protein